ncbi:class I SAM-dependent methyltransferase [Tunturiibacter gelidoferens]|uniref:SAM-dependent methyltransferase n=1 Tax=Tunturiibacter gelidiferens TaxID=3069689 RepID=A0ACC5NVP0_9BACT|nr:class I SAM-dependent methyltransferase [Edaphobacter lichenicola]MBB5338671.1 SAM-dependent methyltransferase [Edaphobacter lichenicola]
MMVTTHLRSISCSATEDGEIRLQCPRCHGQIGVLPHTSKGDMMLVCSDCCLKLSREQGIWRALLPERVSHFSRFIKDYEFIRSAEGRGSISADYYLALPYRDLSRNNSQQWTMRARTFHYIEQNILHNLRIKNQRPLQILDLGAGNGWMSYRLALAGHAPVAVDLLTNDRDGVGAAIHYRKQLAALFPRLQAELDVLPFTDDSFDLVIYNASFHYSEDYEKTIAEALRCTRTGGTILIADTPWYSNEASGRQMVIERRRTFTQRYGFPSDGLGSLEFLTDERLRRIETCFSLRWQAHTPNYGMRWLMRPLLANMLGRREPSQFRIYTARVKK